MDNKRTMYRASDDVVFTRVCNQPILARTQKRFAPDGISACVLNETGELIWKRILMKDETSFDSLVSEIAVFFEVDPSAVSESIRSFLNSLKDQGFIRESQYNSEGDPVFNQN